ncbi:MAG: NTP transferase domain-containing protein [Planctomycetota bacterium]|nr:NTP transferase domain-containing protein [Planctomycetota bacterium]
MASEPERLFDTTGVILAAGKGTRMKSDLPKVLHPVLEKPMISHVVSALDDAGVMRLVAIVGYKSEQVIPQLPAKVLYVHQREQLGTGHALICAAPVCPRTGSLLVVCGDTPSSAERLSTAL